MQKLPKRLLYSLAGPVVLLLSVPLTVGAATYNLSADWSDLTNPNSPWSYLVNGTVASSGGARTGDTFAAPGAPPIWGSGFLGWSKNNGSADGFLDLMPGDVYGHTGAIAIDWTSPITGTIDLSGATWQLRNIGRLNDWSVSLGSTVLTSGTIVSGDGHSRANPNSFSFPALPVTEGEIVEFRAFNGGDYLGVDFTITSQTVVPVPAALWLFSSALGGLGILRRRTA